jgi:hypothetical protein
VFFSYLEHLHCTYMSPRQACCFAPDGSANNIFCLLKQVIGKFVILKYDKILFTEYAKPTARKSSKKF